MADKSPERAEQVAAQHGARAARADEAAAEADVVVLAVKPQDMSGLIEQIHDGTFFADWVGYWLFLPAGVVLLVLWLTSIWMFFLPYYARRTKQKRKSAQSSSRQPASDCTAPGL